MVQILDLDIGIQECLTVMGAHKIGMVEKFTVINGDCQYDGWTGTRATGKSNPCLEITVLKLELAHQVQKEY